MMKKTIQLLLAMCFAIPAFSQSVELHAPAGPQDGGPVEVALEINDFTTNIGAVTLKINFDTDLLSFSQIQDFTVGGFLLTNPTEDGLNLSWITPNFQTGSNLDGLFLTLVFDYQGGFDADIAFDEEESEVASLESPIPGVQWLGTTIFSTGSPVGTISLNNGALVPSVPGENVSIPLYISGFDAPDEAHAFDLKVEYDMDRLNYLPPTENSIGFTVGHDNGIIDLNVFDSAAPIDFDNEPVIMLNFQYLGTGKADVRFKPGSIVNGAAGQILNVLYESSGVNDDITAIAGQLTIEKVTSEGMIADDLPVTEEVSVSASGLSGENITALTLNIAYDNSPDKLVYKNYIPGPLGGGWTFNHSDGMLTFQKVDLGGFTIADGELFTLVFDYYGEFDPGNPSETMQADIVFAPATLLQNEDFEFLAPGLVDGWVALSGIGLFDVVFTVEDADGIPITDANITFDGVPNAPGVYEFDKLLADTYDYLVEKTDYYPVSGQVEVIDQNVFIKIVLISTDDVVANLGIAFDETVTVIGDQCFAAYYNIVVAGQGFDFIVEAGASATLIAGESITLLPGVSVKPGGSLHAYISQTSFCPSQAPDKDDDALTVAEEMEGLTRTGPFFKVFPNPTTGEFRVELEDVAYDKDVLVEVYDLIGNRVISELAFSERLLLMSLAGQPIGMYIIRVTVDGQVGMERLIKR